MKLTSLVILLPFIAGIHQAHAQTDTEIFVQLGHSKSVTELAFSSDGKWLFSGGGDGTAKLWDVASGREIRTVDQYAKTATDIAFPPSSNYALFALDDGSITMVDITTGDEIGTVEQADYNRSYHRLDPYLDDSKVLSKTRKVFRLVDLQSGKVDQSFRYPEDIFSVAFFANGNKMVTGSKYREIKKGDVDPVLNLWDTRTGKIIRSFKGHNGSVNSVVVLSSQNTIVSGSSDGTIRFWNPDKKRASRTIEAYDKGRYPAGMDLVVSPDQSLILSEHRNTLKLWKVSSGEAIRTIEHKGAQFGEVRSITFSPDGKRFATGDDQGIIRIWDIRTGKVVRQLSGYANQITGVRFSPDGNQIVMGTIWDPLLGTMSRNQEQDLRLWSARSGRLINSPDINSSDVSSLVFSPDGTKAVSKDENNLIYWDTRSGRVISTLKGHTATVSTMAFSKDGQRVLSGSWDNTVKLWDAASGKLIRTLASHSNRVFDVAFSADESRILSSSADGTVILWDSQSGEAIRTFRDFDYAVSGASFSKSGAVGLFTTRVKHKYHDDPALEVWDLKSGTKIFTHRWEPWQTTSYDISPDGSVLLTGGEDNTITLWDLDTGQTKDSYKMGERSSEVTSVAFSPDGDQILASDGYYVRVLDRATGNELRAFSRLDGSSASVRNVAFAPSGNHILVGHGSLPMGSKTIKNPKVKAIDLNSGRLLKVRTFEGISADRIAFSPDGKRLLLGSTDTSLKLWDLEEDKEVVSMVASREGEWVTVTPDGYFDGSTRGADMLNVRIGNKVYSLDNFFETYFRPDIIQIRINGSVIDEEVVEQVQEDIRTVTALPPEVTIVEPASDMETDQQTVTITVQATVQSGEIDEIRLYHNGKVVSDDQRGLKLKQASTSESKSYTVSLVPGRNLFRATAFNAQRMQASGVERVITLKKTEARTRLFVIAVGLNSYKNPKLSLNYGRPDANAFVGQIRQAANAIFSEIKVIEVYDQAATKAGITAAFEQVEAEAAPEDAFIFYYAGHGVMSEPTEQTKRDFYIVPFDITNLYNPRQLQAKGFSATELKRFSAKIPALKQVVFLDTCQSGGAVQTFAMRGAAEQKAIAQLSRSTGQVVLAAAGSEQFATEFAELGHGVFTYALLQGIKGFADGGSKDGKITINELSAYLEDLVPELSQKYRGESQYPNRFGYGQDFPVAISNK